MKRFSYGLRVIAAIGASVGIASTACAQWTETFLTPGREAYGAGGSQQVGYSENPAKNHKYAALWSGTADSWVDLNPAGSANSIAYAASGGYQVGVAGNGAALWNGTAASYVSLAPAAGDSAAMGISGNQEVGFAYINNVHSAGLWSGTAASWVDLNPAGNPWSEALATSGNQQVGVFNPLYGAQGAYAALWNGTADSFVNLNPDGLAGTSQAYATDGVHQGGEVGGYATVWSGTAASAVDLNPTGASSSAVTGLIGDLEVGAAEFKNSPIQNAGYWTGSASSWVSLPSISTDSFALGASRMGNTVYIVGQDNDEAVVWTNYDLATPEPAAYAVLGLGALGLVVRKRRTH